MSKVLENVIVAAEPDAARHTVALTWRSGSQTVSTFEHLLGKGVFKRLAEPEFFMRVGIGERGRSLEWPGDIDFCADALWFEAHPEDAPSLIDTPHIGTVAGQ